MSANKYEVREMKFNLVRSTIEHEDDKNHPDWYGSTLIDGVEHKIAGWTSVGKDSGNKYISCKMQVKVDTTPKENVSNEDIFE